METNEFVIRYVPASLARHPLPFRSGAQPDTPIQADWIAITEVSIRCREPHSWPTYYLQDDGTVLAYQQSETLELALDQASSIAGVPRGAWSRCRVPVPVSGIIPRSLVNGPGQTG